MFVPPSPATGETPISVSAHLRRGSLNHEQGAASPAAGCAAGAGEAPPTRMVDRRREEAAATTARVDVSEDEKGAGVATAESAEGDASAGRGDGFRVPVALVADEIGSGRASLGLGAAKQVLGGDDWRRKVAVLRQLQEQLAAEGELGAEETSELVPFMESVAMVCRALRETRPEVSGTVRITQLLCSVISALAKAAGAGFCVSAAAIIPELLPFLSTPREAVQEAIAGSVEVMLAECPSPGVLRAATVTLVGSKKAYLRRKGSGFLCVAIEQWPPAALRTALPPIMGQMRKALFDADATVRREGRQTFGVFIRLWPAEGGGMYHALDRANQRAVLQEQPHVSNFISGKGPKESIPAATDAVASADPAESTANAAAAAAAANAATRIAMAGVGGGGGGGGQRAAGVTQAQHRSLLQWKLEKDRERGREKKQKDLLQQQQREASAAAGPYSRSGGLTPTKETGGGSGVGGSSGGGDGESPASTGATLSGGVAGLRSPPGSAPKSASRLPAPSSCSDGLRRAARLALRKNDLMSPTLKRLLREPSQLQAAAGAAAERRAEAGNVGEEGRFGWSGGESGKQGGAAAGTEATGGSSPALSTGSEESRLSENEGRDGGGDAGGGGGAGGGMTPGELRRSMGGYGDDIRTSPRSDGAESCMSSCSSACGSTEDGEEEDRGMGGHLPTRMLFTKDAPSPRRAPSGALASAGRRPPALDMKPPPPRPSTKTTPLPTGVAARYALDLAASMQRAEGKVSCDDASVRMTSPRALSVQDAAAPAVSTPRRGILASGGAGKNASSTAKRRVRFMPKQGGALSAASLSSPCRSKGGGFSLAGGWWSKADATDGEEDAGYRSPGGVTVRHERPRRSCAIAFSALAVATSVAVVALLGDGDGVADPRLSHSHPVSPWSAPVIPVAAYVPSSAIGRGDPWKGSHEKQGEYGGGNAVPMSEPNKGSHEKQGEYGGGNAVPMSEPNPYVDDPTNDQQQGYETVESEEEVPEQEDDAPEGLTLETGADVLGDDGDEEVEGWPGSCWNPALDPVVPATDEDAAFDRGASDSEGEAPGMEVDSEGGSEMRVAPSADEAAVAIAMEATVATATMVEVAPDCLDRGDALTSDGEVASIRRGEIEAGNAEEALGMREVGGTTPSFTPTEQTTTTGAGATASTGGGAGVSDQPRQLSDPPNGRRRSDEFRGRVGGPGEAQRRGASSSPPGVARELPAHRAPAPSMWGWVEVGVAVIGAIALLATIVWNSQGGDDDGCSDYAMGIGGVAPSTPTGRGCGGGVGEPEGDGLGFYDTVEMVKRGRTPATLRSVKRSRRISSAHKTTRSSVVVMDLGATSLDLGNA